jgi:hypothetical protein
VPGSVTVSAVDGGVSGTAALTVTAPVLVSIAVAPAAASLVNGQQVQFIATGLYSDHSTQNVSAQAAWISSSPGVATIGTGGLASALAPNPPSGSAARRASARPTKATVRSVISEGRLRSGRPSS